MIIGIGTDLVDVRRIEKAIIRHKGRFEVKCYTAYEQNCAKGKSNNFAYFAKRFAAKEAFAKALGTGFDGGFSLRDIGVEENKAGQPFIVLAEPARLALARRMPKGQSSNIHLSLSDEHPYALAFVVIEVIGS